MIKKVLYLSIIAATSVTYLAMAQENVPMSSSKSLLTTPDRDLGGAEVQEFLGVIRQIERSAPVERTESQLFGLFERTYYCVAVREEGAFLGCRDCYTTVVSGEVGRAYCGVEKTIEVCGTAAGCSGAVAFGRCDEARNQNVCPRS